MPAINNSPRCARTIAAATAVAAVLAASTATAAAGSEQQSLAELKNTVINLLQALVDQGVMSPEKAASLVKDAQDKAAVAASAEAEEQRGSVRVTHVPEIVKEDIRRQVAEELRPVIVADVTARAKEEQWGVPAALPDWLGRIQWSGDVRLRAEAELFADGNLPFTYKDYLTINERGGEARAGVDAFVNTTEDRYRARFRVRLAMRAELAPGLTAGARLVTGGLRDPVSTNQTLGMTGGKYTVGFDQGYIRWDAGAGRSFNYVTVQGGRFENPWVSSEMLYDRDLTFDGVSATGRIPFGSDSRNASNVFLTIGAHPLEEIEVSSRDKMLLAAQLGTELRFDDDHRLRAAAAYYDFRNVQGQRNSPESTLLDYTAPRFLQLGNTVFDIRNTLDPTANLYALAGKYRIVNAIVSYDGPVFGETRLFATGDVVRNVGWNTSDALRNTGSALEERTEGYQFELGAGTPQMQTWGDWRTSFAYRYVQRDALLDAFTDSDLRGGGTDIEGFIVSAELGVWKSSYVRLRYLSADELDGARATPTASFPFGQDTIQLDYNASF